MMPPGVALFLGRARGRGWAGRLRLPGRLGQPGVQAVAYLVGSVGATAALIADNHGSGGGHAREGGQSKYFLPAHLLRLDGG